jgi:hypothetical protein
MNDDLVTLDNFMQFGFSMLDNPATVMAVLDALEHLCKADLDNFSTNSPEMQTQTTSAYKI